MTSPRPTPALPDMPVGRAAQGGRVPSLQAVGSATQTVLGEGLANARLMPVGEQPGDQEDLAERPFVRPAGQILDRALAEVGIDRTEVYATNAVKHSKFESLGRR